MKILHIPVLCDEIIENLYIHNQITNIIDCTLGEGGMSEEILSTIGDVYIFGLDTDSSILNIAKKRLSKYENIDLINENYINISKNKKINKDIHNIIFDLGLSNYHLRNSNKGFSFDSNNILDMRFDESENLTAHQIINQYNKKELLTIFKEYADFPINSNTNKFIEHIVQKRPIDTCENLKKICLNFYRNLPYSKAIQNITRIFQAIRIEVNNEFENIKQGLENAFNVIEPKGRILVITYHSGEDRIVKNIFREYKSNNNIEKQFKLVNKKVIKPSFEEQKRNSSSRSAKLRIIERVI